MNIPMTTINHQRSHSRHRLRQWAHTCATYIVQKFTSSVSDEERAKRALANLLARKHDEQLKQKALEYMMRSGFH